MVKPIVEQPTNKLSAALFRIRTETFQLDNNSVVSCHREKFQLAYPTSAFFHTQVDIDFSRLSTTSSSTKKISGNVIVDFAPMN